MASPQEAFGISPVSAELMRDLPARQLAGHIAPWLGRIGGSGPNAALEVLASKSQDHPSLAHESGGDLRAMYVELATRAVRTLLGPDARIVMGEENG